MGHLHLKYAGGLEHFVGADVPIIHYPRRGVQACMLSRATGVDLGVYLGDTMDLENLNWQTFTEPYYDLFQGITIYHSPGHILDLCAMQINLAKEGTFIWTTDLYYIKESFEISHPQGWLERVNTQWCRSNGMIKNLKSQFNATLIFGHNMGICLEIINNKAKRAFE
jgi:hypothetical protein